MDADGEQKVPWDFLAYVGIVVRDVIPWLTSGVFFFPLGYVHSREAKKIKSLFFFSLR